MRVLEKALSKARGKIQLERMLKGGAVLIVYLLLASIVSTIFLSRSNFSDDAIFWCRFWGVLGLLLVVWQFILWPLIRPPSLRQVARFLEERHPGLEERLSTALEVSRDEEVHPEIQQLIRRDASQIYGRLSEPRFYWPNASRLATVVSLIAVTFGSILFLSGPGEFGYGLGKLLGTWLDEEPPPLYQLVVDPGDTRVAERADLEVTASLQGFESDLVTIYARYQNDPEWESTRMVLNPDSGAYSFLFFDVREPIDYFVESEGIRSDTYRIDVLDIPRVEQVRITLNFPAYTGMSNAVLEDESYIQALRGTRVGLEIFADQPATAGIVRFENGGDLQLTSDDRSGSRRFEGSFELSENDYFRIHLANAEGVMSPASDEFTVQVLEDQKPLISFNLPGRDRPVTNIEEVFTEVRAEDDYGLRSLQLNFSVNGSEEVSLPLEIPRGSRDITSSHTFYLEEFDLMPGDFVSYYARAQDAVSSAATDIFFLEVEPFDKEYRQSQMPGGAGAGGQQALELSRQQKQIVVATFTLIEEAEEIPAAEQIENSQTLALVQQRLITQAQTIVERIERRGAALSDSRFRRMLEHLQQAVEHMGPAHESLNSVQPAEALPQEQKALQQLLRAEALFNEVQVSFSQSGAGGQSSPQELADLVDLELDRTKNQYETLQQNRRQQRDQKLDEAMEKLKELARRQEQELERRRQQTQSGGGGSGSNEEMATQLEELARQLARLSRQERNEQLSQISRELNRAARELRQSGASGQNAEQSMQRAQQAMERMRQAEEALSRSQRSQIRNEFNELKEKAERLAEEQAQVVDQMQEIPSPGANGEFVEQTREAIRDLFWRKRALQEDLQELEGDLHQSARRIDREEPEAARRLKDAGLSIRDERLPEKMQESSELLASGLIGLAQRREQGVEEELQQLVEKVREAERALGAPGQADSEDQLRQALNEAGSLVEKLESIRRRAESARRDEQGEQAEPNDSGRRGEQAGTSPGESQQPGAGQSEQPGAGPSDSQQVQRQQGVSPQRGGMATGFSSTGLNPGDLGREWDQRLEEARELRQLLQGADNPELVRDVQRLLQQMEQIDLERVLSDEEEVLQLKSGIIDGLHQLELELSQRLREREENFLRPVDQDEIPPEFRERVEDYYRRLSSKKQKE